MRNCALSAGFGILALTAGALCHRLTPGLGLVLMPMFWPLAVLAALVPKRFSVTTAALVPFVSFLLTGMPIVPFAVALKFALLAAAAAWCFRRRASRAPVFGAVCALALVGSALAAVAAENAFAAPAKVTVRSLLAEMTDRDALTRFPAAEQTTRLWSSYDRASVGRDKPGWFANADYSQYLRDETNAQGIVEHVMVDAKGPGAIVRAWATVCNVPTGGIIRVYIDGAKTVETPLFDFFAKRKGNPLFATLPAEHAHGHCGFNAYLPIPYAKSCKVTAEVQPLKSGWQAFYYNIETRTYPKGTEVESFSPAVFERERATIAAAGAALAAGTGDPLPSGHAVNSADGFRLSPGEAKAFRLTGPGAVRRLCLDYFEPSYGQPDVPAADCLEIELVFDGVRTVKMPVTAFFCIPAGREDFATRFVSSKRGVFESRWTMPYAKSAVVSLRNGSDRAVDVRRFAAESGSYAWDPERSMHFHAEARDYVSVRTYRDGSIRDLNYLTCRGKGLFVGCGVRVTNPANGWWGEGDEKIYVDGETFPSYIGTGSEDHYCYAWARPESFSHPFVAQPSGLGNLKPGFSTNMRMRTLDAIPYRTSLVFDMELWHSHNCVCDYRTVSWYYALPR